MNEIYVIATFVLDNQGNRKYSSGAGERTIGWFPTLEEAESCLNHDGGVSLEECYYSHAVIEKVSSGPYGAHGGNKVIQWYKFNRDEFDNVSIIKCETPEGFKSCVNLTIG